MALSHGAVSAIVTILCIVIVILASLVVYMTKCCKSFNFGGRNRVSSGQHYTKSKRGRSIHSTKNNFFSAKPDKSKRSLPSRHRRSGVCKRDFQNAGGDYDYTQELNDNRANYPVVGGKDYDYVASKVPKPPQKSKADVDYEKYDAAENYEKAAKRKNKRGSSANSVPHTIKATTSGNVVEYANISKNPITKPSPRQPSLDRNNSTDRKRKHSGHSGYSYKSMTKPNNQQQQQQRHSRSLSPSQQQQPVPMKVMQGGYIPHPAIPAIPAQNYNNPSSNYPAGTKQYPNQPRLAYQLPSPGQLIPNPRAGNAYPGGVPGVSGNAEFVMRSDSRSSDVRKQSAGRVSAWLGNQSQEDIPSAHYTSISLNILEQHHYAYHPVTCPPENQNYNRQCEPPDRQIDGSDNPNTLRQYYTDSAINKVMNDIESFQREQQELQLMPTKLHETTETRRHRAPLEAQDQVTPMSQHNNERMPASSRPLKTMGDPYHDEKMPKPPKVPQNRQSGYRDEMMPHVPKILRDKHMVPCIPPAPLPCDVGGNQRHEPTSNKVLGITKQVPSKNKGIERSISFDIGAEGPLNLISTCPTADVKNDQNHGVLSKGSLDPNYIRAKNDFGVAEKQYSSNNPLDIEQIEIRGSLPAAGLAPGKILVASKGPIDSHIHGSQYIGRQPIGNGRTDAVSNQPASILSSQKKIKHTRKRRLKKRGKSIITTEVCESISSGNRLLYRNRSRQRVKPKSSRSNASSIRNPSRSKHRKSRKSMDSRRDSSQKHILESKRNRSDPSLKSGGSMDNGSSHRNSTRSKHRKSRKSMDSRPSSSQRKERKKDRKKIAEAAKIAAEWLDS